VYLQAGGFDAGRAKVRRLGASTRRSPVKRTEKPS
jgi:hypothetical protein